MKFVLRWYAPVDTSRSGRWHAHTEELATFLNNRIPDLAIWTTHNFDGDFFGEGPDWYMVEYHIMSEHLKSEHKRTVRELTLEYIQGLINDNEWEIYLRGPAGEMWMTEDLDEMHTDNMELVPASTLLISP